MPNLVGISTRAEHVLFKPASKRSESFMGITFPIYLIMDELEVSQADFSLSLGPFALSSYCIMYPHNLCTHQKNLQAMLDACSKGSHSSIYSLFARRRAYPTFLSWKYIWTHRYGGVCIVTAQDSGDDGAAWVLSAEDC